MSRVIKELNASAWQSLFGSRWAEKAHRDLDFSGNQFCLETLGGSDGGLWNVLLNLRRLESLNLNKNELTEVDRTFDANAPFAYSLKVLSLSRNQLLAPVLDLPALEILDLSYNLLESLPSLEFLPNLKVGLVFLQGFCECPQ